MRHDALIPLTHDHHHALAHARRLRLAATGSDEERGAEVSAFLDFYRADTLLHFREEEEVIFPLLIDVEEAQEPLSRLMMEHLRIHALVHDLEVGADPSTMKTLAETLENHIRFEEKTLFPMVERCAESSLGSVSLAPRSRGAEA